MSIIVDILIYIYYSVAAVMLAMMIYIVIIKKMVYEWTAANWYDKILMFLVTTIGWPTAFIFLFVKKKIEKKIKGKKNNRYLLKHKLRILADQTKR